MKPSCNDLLLIFDVTDAIRYRVPMKATSDSRRSQVLELVRPPITLGDGVLVFKAHPSPKLSERCGPSA